MVDKRPVDELTIEELEQIVAIRKREKRLKRLRRMSDSGRLVGDPPLEQPVPLVIHLPPIGPAKENQLDEQEADFEDDETLNKRPLILRLLKRLPRINLPKIANRILLLVELTAIVGLIWLLWDSWQTRKELNKEAAQVQQKVIEDEFPTPEPTPIIGVVLLPGGHTSPISESGAHEGEAAGIPEHLLPLVSAYQPPPVPTVGPEQARRIVIPAINVDHPIVQGDDYEQLKKGVGQHIGSADPGTSGNLVLTAHNDIHGEIFRRLDQLEQGDKITIYTTSRRYVYIVQAQRIVEPTDVSVLTTTRKATITLISCYPYLVDTQRIVVTGNLSEEF
ncbi:MAG: class D sortase [Anaerolineales bacterium]|nr:class D sortase [Anaerolineales bacterium]